METRYRNDVAVNSTGLVELKLRAGKPKSRLAPQLGAAAAAVILAANAVQAATISIPSTAYIKLANSSSATFPTASLGTDGYYFPAVSTNGGASTSLFDKPNYVESVTNGPLETGSQSNSNETNLDIDNGAAYTTGIIYGNNTAGVTLATILLSNINPIPAEFQIALLGDNFAGGNNTDYTVTDGSTSVTTTDQNQRPDNDFYYVDITGASAGDSIVITGTSTGYGGGVTISFGGVAFDTITPAPEPSAAALLGISGVLALRRRRRAAVSE